MFSVSLLPHILIFFQYANQLFLQEGSVALAVEKITSRKILWPVIDLEIAGNPDLLNVLIVPCSSREKAI